MQESCGSGDDSSVLTRVRQPTVECVRRCSPLFRCMLLLTLVQVYDPQSLREKLDAIDVENQTLEEVEHTARSLCLEEGVILFTSKSKRAHDGTAELCTMKKLLCQRGGKNRQADYQRSLDTGRLSRCHVNR